MYYYEACVPHFALTCVTTHLMPSLIFQSVCASCLSLRAVPQSLLLLIFSILRYVLWSLHLSCTSENQSNLVCQQNKRPNWFHAYTRHCESHRELVILPHPTSTVLRTALDHSWYKEIKFTLNIAQWPFKSITHISWLNLSALAK